VTGVIKIGLSKNQSENKSTLAKALGEFGCGHCAIRDIVKIMRASYSGVKGMAFATP